MGRLASGKCKATAAVVVQAGRRVDAADAETARFPVANVDLVRERMKNKLLENQPAALVTSAACGTDLLALEIAEWMQVERFILLPTGAAAFRASSVADRPGNWGELFDRIVKQSQLEVLLLEAGQRGYLETNLRLLDKAQALAKSHHVEARAMVVWNQAARGSDDVTAHFLEQARLRKLPIIEISTL